MDTAYATLSPSQIDVLYLLAIGSPRLDIARDLHLSARTVDQRIAKIKYSPGASDGSPS